MSGKKQRASSSRMRLGIWADACLFPRMLVISRLVSSSQMYRRSKNLSNMVLPPFLLFKEPPRYPPGRRKGCTAPSTAPREHPGHPPDTGSAGAAGVVHYYYEFQGTCTAKSFRQVVANRGCIFPMGQGVHRCDPHSHPVIVRRAAQLECAFFIAFSDIDSGRAH